MNINGVFYPLSELLLVLAKAMETATKKSDINRIVRITLKPSTVIYKKKEGVPMGWKEAYLPDTPSEAWDKQREHAMNNFKIAAHFLKNFADIMRTMNI